MVHKIGMAITGGDNRAVLGALAPIEGAASSAGAPSPSSAVAQSPSSAAARAPSSVRAEAPVPCMSAHADACLGADVGQTEDADWVRASEA
eukprot:3977292-Heterocapsa_arctica.AAC.1